MSQRIGTNTATSNFRTGEIVETVPAVSFGSWEGAALISRDFKE